MRSTTYVEWKPAIAGVLVLNGIASPFPETLYVPLESPVLV
jgi:hypothetical protein